MCSTDNLEIPIDEILANQVALQAEKDRKREEAMKKLRGAVHRAVEFNVTLTAAVLADALHFIKMLLGGEIPEYTLRRTDRVFPEMPSKNSL